MPAAWTVPPWTTIAIVLLAAAYLRGRIGLPERFSRGRAACFLAGLATLWIALASPIDLYANYALWPHMVQHVLLSLVAAPLVVLGMPGVPVFRGLPRSWQRFVGPLLAARATRRAYRLLLHPLTAGILFSLAMWIWHIPALYDLAVAVPFWHAVEHAFFLGTGVLVFWNVFEPWPFRSAWGPLPRVLLLLAIDLQNTVFCGILAFAGRPLYASYETTAPMLGVSPIADQEIAAGLMWVASQAVMLPIAGWLVARSVRTSNRRSPLALPSGAGGVPTPSSASSATSSPARRRSRPTLARAVLGPALKHRAVRDGVRWIAFALLVAVCLDGWLGPQEAPANLAGTLPWTHGRGVVVLGILLVGNLACMGCPFMAPRGLLRRFVRPTRPFPKALRSKWLAVGLVAIWLACYEAFDLWASPMATAWILAGYVAALIAVDAFFSGASFCKHVCPLGQLHGAIAEAAPVEVGVRDAEICERCTTMECIRGAPAVAPAPAATLALPVLATPRSATRIPGCEMHLAQPRKRGNLDCTFCMDCAHACPHDNVDLVDRRTVEDLADDPQRSGVGRISRRLDLAMLAAVLVFGAFANALGMTEPLVEAMRRFSASIGLPDDRVVAFVGTLAFALLVPAVIGVVAAGGSRERFCRGMRGLLPLGASMWAVHFGFHLVTGFSAGWASLQRAAGDVGLDLGTPQWALACCANVPPWLVPAELLALQVGVLVSAAALVRSLGRRAWPWIAIAAALCMLGFWIVQVPMDMRGTVA